MTPHPLPASPADRDPAAMHVLEHPHGGGFIERARQMVAFLAEHDAPAAPAHAPEQDLADWIARWRRIPRRGLDTTQHFIADELGIIARALNGPPECTRLRPERTDQLCWLIARCISRSP